MSLTRLWECGRRNISREQEARAARAERREAIGAALKARTEESFERQA